MNGRIYVALALMLGAGTACSEDSSASGIVIQLATDLTPGVELAYLRVETLSAQGDIEAFASWLTLQPGCTADDRGLFQLGSFGVERGLQRVARIRVVAYAPGADPALAMPIIEQRIDAEFQRGLVRREVFLARACRDRAPCGRAQTCSPEGACVDVPYLRATDPSSGSTPAGSCLDGLERGPQTTSLHLPSTDAPPACVSGDRACPPGCDRSNDNDCPLADGDACEPGRSECAPDSFCAHGVCCNAACRGACERCDLPGRVGICSPVLYSSQVPPRSSPNFRAECGEHHVVYDCASGSCGASCGKGYADCDGKLDETGCETLLGTSDNCRTCGDACRYGYCGEKGCEANASPTTNAGSRPLDPGLIHAQPWIPDSVHRRVRALGALVRAEPPGTSIRFAMYDSGELGQPNRLVLQTPLIAIRDVETSIVTGESGVMRVEVVLEHAIALDYHARYWLAAQVETRAQVACAVGTPTPYLTAAHPYGDFPYVFPDPQAEQQELLSIYTVTTPD